MVKLFKFEHELNEYWQIDMFSASIQTNCNVFIDENELLDVDIEFPKIVTFVTFLHSEKVCSLIEIFLPLIEIFFISEQEWKELFPTEISFPSISIKKFRIIKWV